MNCLIIDKVWGGIAEELSKVMNVKTAANLWNMRNPKEFRYSTHRA